jgi:hypothetical protein
MHVIINQPPVKGGDRALGSASSFFWGFIFGTIGMGFFIYGKKQQKLTPLLVGIGLMVFPYFITDPLSIVLIGGVLMAVPYFYRD